MSTSYHEARADRAASARTTIPCFDPATLEPLGEVPVCPADQVAERVEKARMAQARWAKTSFSERREVLGKILDHVLAHADELCRVVVKDAGKTRENALLGEIWPVCEKLRHTIATGEKHLASETVGSGLFMHKKATIDYVPRGVVGIITPWNYPLQNILGPTIPALMAGNGVVVKVSEWTAWSASRFQRIFDEALSAVGVPTDLVQVINGYAETGAALVSSGVDLVIFTGSMANGRRIVAQSAETLTPVILELGGKDAFIVCDDAHVEQAVHAALAGVYIAAGQNCLAAERFFVMDRVYDAFEKRVVEAVAALRQGPPLRDEVVDVGALVSPAQLEVVEGLVKDAVEKGARVLVGGKRGDRDGQFFQPTVLAGVTPEMAIMQEETFGPIMVLSRVKDEAEAIARANETQFGLGATVMTKSRARARRIKDALVCGNVSINDFGFTYMAMDLPFGGVAGSGFGRLNGRDGLRACTTQKAVLSDRFPLHFPSKLYPVGPKDYDLARGVIRTLYGRGVKAKLSGIGDLASTLLRRKR
ncbi:MAG: aldehyde dehydrogenase family protein [Myxococcales bacterium]|nr:aldehyde dehydrogenase family protein [Myxococcales bacterium]